MFSVHHLSFCAEKCYKTSYLQNTCQQSNKYPNFNFNVSHSGNFVGITSEPVFLVGLDIVSYADFKQQATLNLLNGLSSHFTCLEWNNIISAENSNLMLAEFCRYKFTF